MVISFVFYTYLCLIFVHIFFKSSRKMSTALKNTLYYSSLMNLCRAVTGNTGQNLVTRQLQISGQADAECSPAPMF